MTVELLVGAPAGQALSPQQRRLAILGAGQQHEPFRAVCVTRVDLSPERLRAALAEVVRRHPILRPGFRLEVRESADGENALAEELRTVELAGAPYARFDPSRGLLGLALPALASDLVGIFNVAAQIAGAGTRATDDGAPQYCEVAEVLDDLLAADDAEGGLDRWRRDAWAHFAELSLPLEERTREPLPFRPAVQAVEVPGTLVTRAGALGTAPADFLLAAWLVLLRRLTGERDLVVGLTCDGRDYPGLEAVIGPLARVLPLPFRVGDAAPLPTLLEQIAARTREAREWQDYFVWDEPEWLPYSFEAVVAPPGALRHYACLDRFRLKLSCSIRPDGIAAELCFDPAALPPAEASRLVGWLSALLSDLVEHPDSLAGALEILPAAERRQLLTTWNDTAVDYPGEESLHELVAVQAERTPDRVAVESGDEHLTFSTLLLRARGLAAALRRLGAGPERTVAICAERSLEMVVGLLAILESGASYVPLDPDHPAERLTAMLRGSRAHVLLAQEHLLGHLPDHDAHLLLLGEGEGRGAVSPPGGAEPRHGAGGFLAYVLYTSGSTGEPKGVMVSHRAIRNRLLWMQTSYPLGAEDRVLQKTPFGFDASIWELFVPLLSGARLVMARPDGQRDPRYLVDAVAERGITVLQLVPSMLRVTLEEPGVEAGWRGLRQLYCGGEALPADLQERFFERLPGVRLHNLYGPTETAIDAAHRPCSPGESFPGILIGRPIGNLRLYMVDELLRLLPAGLPGELCIGGVSGAGLARGYLGRPDLTAERFVPDPFAGVPGERLYRSGDLARFLPDGSVEFLGRRDQQVKLRGFRIEPGEIEAALARHPGLTAAVVLAREDVPGRPQLVAYVVPAAGSRPSPAELADDLASRLPDFMVPAAFVALTRLPLLSNGKLDRAALPPPSAADLAGGGAAAAPRNPAEELLAELWKDLLGLQEVGVHDDFFRLGGQSLLATRLVSRVRETFGTDLPLREVFEAPTIAGLAERVEAARRRGLPPPPPLERVPRGKGELPLSFAQQRLWFLDQLEPGGTAYNIPLAVRLSGRLEAWALDASLREIVRRHESLRTRFPEVDGRPAQVIGPPPSAGDWFVPLVDLAGLPAEAGERELSRLAVEEVTRPFDLARGPLLRALLLRAGSQEHAVVATMHHIVSDAWSSGVLVRELATLYPNFAAGLPSSLPELPVQYPDFAAWQRRWLAGEVLEAQLAYWRGQLAGLPPEIGLPLDRPRPPVPSYRGGAHFVPLGTGLTEALAALGRRAGATSFMTLLAAFQALLARISGQDDVAVGSPVANRTRPELEDLIGFFVNALVLRARMEGDPSFRQHLAAVRETTLGAYDHQDVPFEQLVEILQPERSTGRNPLFQVMLVLQNAPREAFELPGIELRPQPAAGGTAKFDLTLTMFETPVGLAGALEYATDLFDPATAERLMSHFSTLLEGAVAAPERRFSELPLLGEAERRQLLEWNDRSRRAPLGETTLTDLLRQQAAARPDAVAVVWGEERLSHAGLAARAARLARRLRALAVGPETPVGVLLPRDPRLVEALLAVMSAGGFYVPLDPAYPDERLGWLLADSGARQVLTRRELAGRLPPGVQALVLEDLHGLDEPAEDATLESGSSGTLAYLIYTSGSTGRPKAVAVEGRSSVRLVSWAAEVLTPDELAGVLASTSLSFDLSVFEILVTLCLGGRIVLADHALELPDLPMRHEVSLLNTVPSAAAELVRLGGVPPSVRTVCLAGETLPRALARALYALPQVERVYNLYGPSEDTTYSTWALVEREGEGAPDIGRPVAGSRAWVVDGRGASVPVGVAGELWLAGEGLARGYLGRPELTAERFVPEPWPSEAGARAYRTGDLARWRPDGTLEFLGRLDHQVKIRGFRVEPGEIEAALTSHPGIREAAVVARQDGGAPRLVAYVVPGGEPPAVQELREALRRRLPDFMVPASWVTLDALPRTATGKLDRKALPEPGGERPEMAADYVAPRDPVEQILADLWRNVLGIERVGAHDSFFDLGGHSLLATQVVSRVRKVFKVELPLREFFGATTVAALAGLIRRHEAKPGQTEAIARAAQKIASMSAGEVRDQLGEKRRKPE